MEKLLLHICCAPCGGYLTKEFFKNYRPVLFFYNPNIWPEEEYSKRLAEIKKFCQQEKIDLIVGEYNYQKWLELTRGYEQDPEGGGRCRICFKMRLEKTAQEAKNLGIKSFSTSLGISPYKNLSVLKKIGTEISRKFNLDFVIFDDETKKNLWPKARQFSHQERFYHQKYCGCVYSFRKTK